jgi:hypothetical protein
VSGEMVSSSPVPGRFCLSWTAIPDLIIADHS